MDCEEAQALISARVDGELTETMTVALDEHLRRCSGCAAWEGRAYALRRTLSMRSPAPPDGLADRVLARVAVPDPGASEWVRYALGVVAATIAVVNAPLLVLGRSDGAAMHDSRHLGAFGVALGIGLLWAALRPERANGLVPYGVTLAAVMLVGSAVDLSLGRATTLAEGGHVLELIGLVLLWRLSGGHRRLSAHVRSWRASRRLWPV
jgi:predicted anti-sigma-YlaC factor YlaD